LYRRFGGQDLGKIPGRSQRILLEASKKECLVLANRASAGEAINVLTEDGLRRLIDFIDIGNRVETLRLKSPEQRAMQAVCAGLVITLKMPPPARPNSTPKLPVCTETSSTASAILKGCAIPVKVISLFSVLSSR